MDILVYKLIIRKQVICLILQYQLQCSTSRLSGDNSFPCASSPCAYTLCALDQYTQLLASVDRTTSWPTPFHRRQTLTSLHKRTVLEIYIELVRTLKACRHVNRYCISQTYILVLVNMGGVTLSHVRHGPRQIFNKMTS